VILGLGVVALAAIGSAVPDGLDVPERVWNGIVTPYYLAMIVPPVLMGILLAGLLFADISTTDQYLMSWSTSIVNDCVVPLKKKPFSQTGHIKAVRVTIIVLCLLFFINGLFYEPTMPLWEYMWLCANIIGGTGIAVLAGMYWRRATTAGAYAAVLCSLVLPLADLVGRRIFVAYHPGESIAWKPEYTGFSTYVLAALLLVVISLLFPGKTKYWDLGKTVREMNVKKETG
jgi:SSS family solute:Na+ symporter